MRIYTKIDPVVRFNIKFSKPENGCWLWSASLDGRGYGKFFDGERLVIATHYAWELASGTPFVKGNFVLHTCDVPSCVRNDEPGTYKVGGEIFPRFGHLFLGTARINSLDMSEKRRGSFVPGHHIHPRGEQHGHAKLTDTDVQIIRKLYSDGWRVKELAERFGVSQSSIARIRDRISWTHIE